MHQHKFQARTEVDMSSPLTAVSGDDAVVGTRTRTPSVPHHRRSVSINWTGDTSLFSVTPPGKKCEDDKGSSGSVGSAGTGADESLLGQGPRSPEGASTAAETLSSPFGATGQESQYPAFQLSGHTGAFSSPQVQQQHHQHQHYHHAAQAFQQPYLPPQPQPMAHHHHQQQQRHHLQQQQHMQHLTPDLNQYPDYLYGAPGSAVTGASGSSSGSAPPPAVGPGLDDASIPGAGNTYTLPLSAYSAAFPGTSTTLPTLSGLPSTPAYTEPSNVAAFRDGLAAADSLKTMSIQMAAFLNAQQQLYAAQVAQMAAMTNGSAAAAAAVAAASNPAGGPDQHHLHHNSHHHPSPHHHLSGGLKSSPGMRGHGKGSYGGVLPGQGLPSSGRGNKNLARRGGGNRHHDDMPGGDTLSQSRSALLDEFRASTAQSGAGSVTSIGRDWQLVDIKGHIVEFATDQHGSRFIQQRLETATPDELDWVLAEVLSDAHRLINDVFGNFSVQRLIHHGNPVTVNAIAAKLKGRMLSLSMHMYACRVVQKTLELLEPAARADLVSELDGHVTKCIHDQNANHVIQKAIEVLDPESMQFIVRAVQENTVSLACHSYGCRVLQRILEHGTEEQKAPITTELMSSVGDLVSQTYSNYCISWLIEHGKSGERSYVIDYVKSNLVVLSCHRFASNVIERCLQFGSDAQREELIAIMLGDQGPTNSPLKKMISDSYANYVVQRALDVARPYQRQCIVEVLRSEISTIRKFSYGKHLLNRIALDEERC